MIVKEKNIFKYILFDVVLFGMLFLTSYLILNYFGYSFLNWIIDISILLVVSGIIIGTIQLINKFTKKKNKKKYLKISIVLAELIIILPITLGYFLLKDSETIVYKDNKIMIKSTHSVWLSNWINYYDFKGIFIRSKQERIHESHNNYIGDCYYSYYYDEKGTLIKTDDPYYNNKNFSKFEDTINISEDIINIENINTEVNNNNSKILYERNFDEATSIRVIEKDHILSQRVLIGIQKTTDGGKTWKEQISTQDGVIQIHNGAKFVFLNENLGFINDLGLVGTQGENRQLKVTTDGGKTFRNIKFENKLLEQIVYIEDLPYIDNIILKIKAYTIENSEKKYIELFSEDGGITWKQEKMNI